MTFCGYNDIYDFCRSNKYEYRYGRVVKVSGNIIPDTSDDAPIIRFDTSSSAITTITNSISSNPEPCSQYDSGDIISDWECYQEWKNYNATLDAPLNVYKDFKRQEIETSYSEKISAGYSLTLNSNTVALPRDPESQQNILSTLVQSIIEDKDPTITTIDGEPVTIPRSILQAEIPKYTKSNQELLNNKNEAINLIDGLGSTEDINGITFETATLGEQGCPAGYTSDGAGGCSDNFVP